VKIEILATFECPRMHAIVTRNPFLCTGSASEKEAIMRVTNLILVLVTAGALATLGQEGAVETVKQGAKKTGEKIKEGVETVGEKTKRAAETVGEKTKETAQTVGRKSKEAVETTGEKTTESTNTAHRKSKKTVKKTTGQGSEEQSSNREPNTPAPSDH